MFCVKLFVFRLLLTQTLKNSESSLNRVLCGHFHVLRNSFATRIRYAQTYKILNYPDMDVSVNKFILCVNFLLPFYF